MRIIGVDPGFNATGFGVIDVDKTSLKIIDAGSIEPNAKLPIQERLIKIHHILSEIITQHQPEILVLEKIYAHYKHPATAALLGHVRGVICLLTAEHQITLVEAPVKRIRKALMGNGNASKAQVQAFVKRLLKLEKANMSLDTSDALALALGQAHMLRYKII